VDPVSKASSRIDAASSTLVLRPQSATDADSAWKRALIDDPDATALIGISLSQQPSVWYEEWCDTLETAPADAAVIATPELTGETNCDDIEVKTVATSSNLTGIGVKTTPYLSRWKGPVVVIDPLTLLFQYADTQEVYQFLHVLLTRARTSGGSVQVYADPAVETDRTVELLKSLFDAVVEYDPDADGEDETPWNVRHRS
jgi:hypothetical protein